MTRSPRLWRGIPPVGSRPFLVAGLGAVWLGLDCPIPSDLQIEDYGNGNSDGMDAGSCSLVLELPEVIVQNHLA